MRRRRAESSESRVPLWIVEGFDIAEQRRVVLLGVAVALSVVGAVLSVLAPGIVPPRALVGAAVGVAALMLGYAAAVAVDAADLTVWGPRHVRAAGGEVVAIVPTQATLADARPLARAVLDARDGEERVLLGVAAAGREHRLVSDWSEAVATALAEEGVSVLFVDLAAGRSDEPGLYEVVEQGLRIGSVAEIDEELLLARLRAGSDLSGALAAVRSLPERLPRDLDVLLLSLPTAASREVVEAAAAALDHVLLVAERGTTARVDLIAALDALEGTGTSAQAVLADDRTVSRMTGRSASGGGAAANAFTASAGPTAPVGGVQAADARGEDAPADASDDEVPAEARGEDAPADAPDEEAPAEARGEEVPADAPDEEPASSTTDEVDGVVGLQGVDEGVGAMPEEPAEEATPEAQAEDESTPGVTAADEAPEAPVEVTPASVADDDPGTGGEGAPTLGAPEPDAPESGPPVADARDTAAEEPVEARAPEVLGAARAALAAYRTENRAQPSETQPLEAEPSETASFGTRSDGGSDAESPARERDDADDAGKPAHERDDAADAEDPYLTSAMPAPERARPPEQVPDLEPTESAEPARDVSPEEADTDAEDPLVTTARLAILVDELEDRRGQEHPGQG